MGRSPLVSSLLLDRILELESELEALTRSSNNGTSPAHSDPSRRPLQPPSTALPRHVIAGRAHSAMVVNLRQAMDEIRTEDASPDSHLVSRPVNAQPRKRQVDEIKEYADDENRGMKKPKTNKQRGVSTHVSPSSAPKGIEGGVPATPPSGGDPSAGLPQSQVDPTLVSSSGKRLRIKPLSTAQPQDGHSPGQPNASSRASDSPYTPSQPSTQFVYNSARPSGNPSPPENRAPRSPVAYDGERYPPSELPTNGSPTTFRNGYGQSNGSGNPMTSPGLAPPNGSQHGSGVPPSGGNFAVSPRQGAFSPASASASRTPDGARHAKPKRLKAHTVTSKTFNVPSIPRDKKGKPLLPLNVGIMTVISLGEVCMREHFHTERYIFPVGYEVTRCVLCPHLFIPVPIYHPFSIVNEDMLTAGAIVTVRRYLSAIDPTSETVYHCTILDGGDGPKFQIVAQDQPSRPIAAGTATGAWSVVVRAANHIRNRQHSNSVSGPDFFGLGQNTIKKLIQELPNADKLRDYVWQHFWEGG